MIPKLTEQQLQKAAKPGPKPFEIVCGPTPGLRLSVQPSGAMSWCLRYRANGRGRKMVFANYPGLPLPEARKVAIGLSRPKRPFAIASRPSPRLI